MALTIVSPPTVLDGLCYATVAGEVTCYAVDQALAPQGWTGGCTLSWDGTNTVIICGCTEAQLTAALAAYAPVVTPAQAATAALQSLVTNTAPMMAQAQTDIANWATYSAAEQSAATLRTIQGVVAIAQGLAYALQILELIEVPAPLAAT